MRWIERISGTDKPGNLLNFRWEFIHDDLFDLKLLTGLVDINADEITIRVAVQTNSIRHFPAVDVELGRQIDVKRVGFWIVTFIDQSLTLGRSCSRGHIGDIAIEFRILNVF